MSWVGENSINCQDIINTFDEIEKMDQKTG